MSRPTWDEYFLKQVEDIALRATCTRRQIGAIITRDNKIVSSGYCGTVRGAEHCIDKGCIRDELGIESGTQLEVCDAVHAEANAIIQAEGDRMGGATIYVNAYPCKICARLIVNAGIKRVVCSGEYSDEEGLDILQNANVEISCINLEE